MINMKTVIISNFQGWFLLKTNLTNLLPFQNHCGRLRSVFQMLIQFSTVSLVTSFFVVYQIGPDMSR